MSCENHPNRETVATCQFCGKELCEDCAISIAGRNYCENCMNDLVGSELTDIATRKSSPPLNPEANLQNQESAGIQSPVAETNAPPVNENDDLYRDNRAYDEVARSDNISRGGTQEYANQANQDYIEPEHGPETDNVEERYEKYLDDLYYDEPLEENPQRNQNIGSQSPNNENLSLSEQLAADESIHGSLTREPYVPDEPQVQEDYRQHNVPITRNLKNTDGYMGEEERSEYPQDQYYSTLHGQQIHYKEEADESSISNTEIGLTVVLIILIIFVILYVIYLLTLHDYYPNFFDAIGAFFTNPGDIINVMFG